ncbi:hypothetical protein BCR34DRAFT_284207 [Clohesyomyces aquaticus]|uniref:Uncharacterized protein n=1 Tax=Clohesyomyces aquaticus TaxID=1231657 RepID=A0A1Y1ZRB4_9PLEO|nr:hypothetical protein BCR34DRAFT_284207 [Clohesyomyces aquaticus]
MVLPILIAVITAPALLGTQESIRQSQAKEKREEHRARRCNLIATCVKSSLRSREINGRPIVLKNGKLYIDTGTSDGEAFGHPYAGYFLPYPDEKYEGLVTTITDEAPIMNWVYVDKDTHEVKYGVRVNAQPNLTGPFDCTRQDRRLIFDGWEGWCAVEEFPTIWALYFDKDDDGLRSKVAPGTRVLEVELARKEKKWVKEVEARKQDQTTKRSVETREDAPVDTPITVEPQLNLPGTGSALPEPFKMPKSIFAKDPPAPAPEPVRPITPPPKTPPPKTPPPKTPPTKTPPPKTPPPKTPPPNSLPPKPSPVPVGSAKSKSSPLGDLAGRPLRHQRGSRALAQAQKFEALGQKSTPTPPPPKVERPIMLRSSSGSDMSESGGNGYAPAPTPGRPDSSTLTPGAPAPTPAMVLSLEPKSKAPAFDPAVFGGYLGEAPARSPQRNRSGSNTSANGNGQSPLRRKDSALTDSEAPKGPLPRVPISPTKGRSTSPSKNKPPVPRLYTGSGSRRPVSPEKNRATSPEKRRLNTIKESPKVPPKSTPPKSQPNKLTKRSPTSASYRRGSESSRDGDSKSIPVPRPLARTATAPAAPPRVSMAATMTTGEKGSMHRNMSSIGGSDPSSADRSPYAKTNSSLYREIEDVLRPSTGTTASSSRTNSNNTQPPRRGDRAPPLKRSATSKAPSGGSEGVRSPLQRMFSIGRRSSGSKKEEGDENGAK